jgi:serine protease AprX
MSIAAPVPTAGLLPFELRRALERSGPVLPLLADKSGSRGAGRGELSHHKRQRRGWTVLAAVVFISGGLVMAANSDVSVGGEASGVEATIDPSTLPPGSMYHVVDQIGARSVWSQGITGAGVTVAVIDSGISPGPAISTDKIVATVDLTAEAIDPSTRYLDTNGHGTMMSGIIAGAEAGADPLTSAEHAGDFLGVAPDAGIVSVKIAGRDGSSDPADAVAGVDWVIANADELGIRVINLSYSSGSSLPYTEDPLTAAVERAWKAGITVVTIAGNDGSTSTQLASPGIDPYVITVAAADANDSGLFIADFSNSGDGVRNPDVAAPGAHIQSLRALGSDADVNHSDVGGVDADPMLFTGTGTSQSAAVTSGVLALLFQAFPDMTPDQAKALLIETATPIPGSDSDAGANLIRADRAIAASLPEATQAWTSAGEQNPADLSALTSCDAVGCWAGPELGGAHLGGAHLGGAHLGGAHLGGAHLGGAHLGGAHLGGAHLGGAHLGGAHLGGAHLGGAHLGGAHLGGAHLGGAHLGGAHLGGAHLGGAHLGGAHLGGAHLGGAHLGGAHLGGAHLGGAHLGGAHLGGAHLGGAHLG